jgi:hypothetical protein
MHACARLCVGYATLCLWFRDFGGRGSKFGAGVAGPYFAMLIMAAVSCLGASAERKCIINRMSPAGRFLRLSGHLFKVEG